MYFQLEFSKNMNYVNYCIEENLAGENFGKFGGLLQIHQSFIC